ncbi:hypothetical protein [Limnobacter sp.]|uniref:hypothetical protein n=1 Tax=Limnobacter sp. TaxID=2003368 RepID=UPI003BABF403
MIEYPKLPIALEYLEAAIEEREIHQRYFAAMNLAGVAEELLGKHIRIIGKQDQLTEVIDSLSFINHSLANKLGWPERSRKDLKNLMASTKNSIKHMDTTNDATAKLYFDVKDESKWLIQAAIRNLDILGIEYSGTVRSFVLKYPESEA